MYRYTCELSGRKGGCPCSGTLALAERLLLYHSTRDCLIIEYPVWRSFRAHRGPQGQLVLRRPRRDPLQARPELASRSRELHRELGLDRGAEDGVRIGAHLLRIVRRVEAKPAGARRAAVRETRVSRRAGWPLYHFTQRVFSRLEAQPR